MYNPNPVNQRLWMQQGARLGGIVIAGRCILVFMFFGFGLMLMGIIAIATSSGFDDFGGKGVNPPRTVGICFLSIGGSLLVLGIIFLCIAKRAVSRMSQENQTVNPTTGVCHPPPGPVLAGTPYAGGPYAPVPTNPYEPYQQPSSNNQYPPHPGGQYPPQPGSQYPPQPGSQYPPQPSYAPNYANPQGPPYPADTSAPPLDAPPPYKI